jgi:hypothetical protein
MTGCSSDKRGVLLLWHSVCCRFVHKAWQLGPQQQSHGASSICSKALCRCLQVHVQHLTGTLDGGFRLSASALCTRASCNNTLKSCNTDYGSPVGHAPTLRRSLPSLSMSVTDEAIATAGPSRVCCKSAKRQESKSPETVTFSKSYTTNGCWLVGEVGHRSYARSWGGRSYPTAAAGHMLPRTLNSALMHAMNHI